MLDDDIEMAGNYTALAFSTITTVTWPIIYMNRWNPVCLLTTALGYFCWDTVVCLLFLDVFGWTMLFHAMVACLGIHLSSQYPQHAFAFLTFEFSSVWLNLMRTNLIPKWKWAFGVLFAVTFIVFRTLFGTYYTIAHLLTDVPWYGTVLALSMNGLNYMWSYKIIKKFC